MPAGHGARGSGGMAARAAVACLLALLVAWAVPAAGQPSAAVAALPAASQPADSLERGTPRGAIAAFVRAANREDFVAAARYLQVTGRRRGREEALAEDLALMLNRHFLQPMSSISAAPQGSVEDGLALDREEIGPLRIAGEEHMVGLVRVQDPVAGPIWLVAAETLLLLPDWRVASDDALRGSWLPAPLADIKLGGVPLARVLGWLGSLLVPLLLVPLLQAGAVSATRRVLARSPRLANVQAWHDQIRWPAAWLVALAVHAAALPWYGTTVGFRTAYGRFLAAALVVVVTWLLLRSLMLWLQHVRLKLQSRGRTGAGSLALLGERLAKLLVLTTAVLALLALAGVDIKAALAGLGIVGIAVALGAQKTVENILGGMMLLGDEAIAIGDLCRISDRLGVVEDITLRSVRIRTTEQTVLSIPAGVLAQATIENFSSRGKILAQSTLWLAPETPADVLRQVREAVEARLAAHPLVEPGSWRIRVIGFAPRGVELELFAYLRTADVPTFLGAREELLLQVAQAVQDAGATFAAPWSTAPAPAEMPGPPAR